MELTFAEMMWSRRGWRWFVAAGTGTGLTVALDTTLTSRSGGRRLCREIINKVQNLRKKSGLEVSDRIELSVSGPGAGPAAVRVRATDRRETLAGSVAATGDMAYKDDIQIDDQEIGIALDRA